MTRALALLLVACSSPPLRPDPPIVVAGCHIEGPPPARPHIARVPCPQELCLDVANAAAWDRYEDELRGWATQAWTRCGSTNLPAHPARAEPRP